MRGWEHVGRVARRTRDFDLWLWDPDRMHDRIGKGDILRFSYSETGPLRSGQVQVKALLADGVVTDERTDAAIVALCDGDHVFRATALGEHAFKRGEL